MSTPHDQLAQQQADRLARVRALTGWSPPQTAAELEALRHPRVTTPHPGTGHQHPATTRRSGAAGR